LPCNLITRQAVEKVRPSQMSLAPYASRADASRGRSFSTSQSPTRSEFQRDRDRIIHSTAFRRLQHKTQVFLHHEGQHFRTRLTHTLEVSQIARSIARSLQLDEDLAEAVALAHDLGHTPFGHAGERVLAERMAQLGGFDHNLQALRVVTLLENRYAEHDGLNLTWEAREGILKHNGPFEGEGDALAAIPGAAGLEPSTHAGPEAQAASIADDIAYDAHDIDDALRAGLLSLDELVDVPLVGPIAREVLERWPDIEPARKAHEIQRRLITRSIEDVIATSAARLAAHAPADVAAIRGAGEMMIGFTPALAAAEKGLKQVLFERVYRAEAVMVPVRQSQEVVADLFERYLETGDMPGRWGAAFAANGDLPARARIVADFIAGMTDPYALAEYGRLFDRKSVLG
jgi:dGTPase